MTAVRAAAREMQKQNDFVPFDEVLAAGQLEELVFTETNIQWLNFVIQNRAGRYKGKKYDMIKGPVANDSVYETVNYYMSGIFTAEQAIERLKGWKLYAQEVFCTEKALSFLQYTGIL